MSCNCIYFPDEPDKPNKPVLQVDVSEPTDGDTIDFTCTSSSPGITNYVFYRGETSLGKTSINKHTILSAAIGANDGFYTCVAYKDSIVSDASLPYRLSCK